MLAKKKIAKKKSANKVIKKIKKGTKSKKALNQKKPIKISTKKADFKSAISPSSRLRFN